MHKYKFAVAIAALSLSGLTAGALAQSDAAGYHVTICHRTGSATNPYIEISPDVEGVVSGHLDHEQTGNGPGGDIIPVFVYHGVTYSKNLGISIAGVSGAAILANGCRVPNATPTPTPPRPTPTPTPPPPGTTPTPPPPGTTPTPPPPPPMPTPPPPEAVPEPMTIILFGSGLAALGFAARKKLFGS